MSLFNDIFGSPKESKEEQRVKFGRFSESHKKTENYVAWDKAISTYDSARYADSIEYLLIYLSDDKTGNIHYSRHEDSLDFRIYQGSKLLEGHVLSNNINVESKVGTIKIGHVAIFRRLLVQNYQLKYSRYGLNSNNEIIISFNSSVKSASPYKLYYALKEMASSTDKNDDLLISEFNKNIEEINNEHIIEYNQEELSHRHAFFKSELVQAINHVDEKWESYALYPAAAIYVYLDCIYKLDFLLTPKGYIMERFEYIQRLYFNDNNTQLINKLHKIKSELVSLSERSKTDCIVEFYQTINTFGIISNTNQRKINGVIDSELPNIAWYQDNSFDFVANIIPSYIVGYCLFNHAISIPLKELFVLFYQINNPSFFHQLGFDTSFVNDQLNLKSTSIKNQINAIVKTNKMQFPYISFSTNKLDFSSNLKFSITFMEAIKDIDLSQKDNGLNA